MAGGKPLELRRLFDVVPRPVFVISAERSLAYVNQALAELVRMAAEQLVGQACRANRPANGDRAAEIAAALDPPPQLDLSAQTSVRVVIPVEDGVDPLVVQASYLVLGRVAIEDRQLTESGEDASPSAVLGWLAPVDQASSDAAPAVADWHADLRAFRARHRASYALTRLVGASAFAVRLRAQIAAAVAADRASVLIVGPPGSGREHLARTIHAAGADASARLVVCDAVMQPAEAIVERLTMLVSHHNNRREPQMSPTTLLLLNVDRLPGEAFGPLATLLEPGVTRVLSTARPPFVSGSHVPAELQVCLSTLTIEVPSLADRIEDVPLLAQAVLEDLNIAGQRTLAGFSPPAQERLLAYGWPGQLDELWQVVREAHSRATGFLIEVGDLPDRLVVPPSTRRQAARDAPIEIDVFLVEVETELLQRAMAQARGNKAKAARLLGMTRPRLYRRLAQRGLVSSEDDDDEE